MPKRTETAGEIGTLQHRLREAVEKAGSARAFARLANVPGDSLNKYLAGKMQPGPSALVKLADGAGVTTDYLLGREGYAGLSLPRSTLLRAELDNAMSVTAALPPEFIMIPRLEVRASAGPGRAPPPDGGGDLVAFRQSWLRSLGISPGNAEFLQAEGDSMDPTIKDGDMMLVDRGYGQVVNGKIYVLVVSGLVLVKRLQVVALGGLQLISDNDRYPPQNISRSDVNELSIEARVAWYGRAI